MLLNCWTYIVHVCVCLAQFKNNIDKASNRRDVFKVDLSYGHVFYDKILLQQKSLCLNPSKK